MIFMMNNGGRGNVKDSVRRRANKSVVKCESHAVLGWQMGVNYIAVKLVRVSPRRK